MVGAPAGLMERANEVVRAAVGSAVGNRLEIEYNLHNLFTDEGHHATHLSQSSWR